MRSLKTDACRLSVMAAGALGGGLALATECDIRIAAEGSRLGIPPSRLGIIYPHERIQVFIDLVGKYFFFLKIIECRDSQA